MIARVAVAFAAMLCLAAFPAHAKDYIVKQPPKSMDELYPPKSPKAKWVDQMHKISGTFGGVFVDMKENDWENAEKLAGKFVEAYKEAADMVPEWKDYFDHDAARAFAETVKTHDPKEIGKAAGAVGKTCHKCHEQTYVAVWTRYHWPSVESIKITDPVTEEKKDYGKYMSLLAGTFRGATVNFNEAQYDRAAKAAGDMKKRLMEMKSTCAKCHVGDDVKQFFVGPAVSSALDAMKAELEKEKPNPGEFWKNVGVIGKQSCTACHLVHRASAIIQEVWEEDEKHEGH